MLVDCQKLVILDTDFGFLGLVFQASKVLHLSLGHTSRSHVLRAIVDCPNLDGSASVCREADLKIARSCTSSANSIAIRKGKSKSSAVRI